MTPALRTAFIAVGVGLATWGGLALRRAAKNFGKTKWQIAEEQFQEAVRQAEEAHADADPNNDNQANENVERQRRMRDRARVLMSLTDAIGDTETK